MLWVPEENTGIGATTGAANREWCYATHGRVGSLFREISSCKGLPTTLMVP
jgi:hypothetical protein